MIWALVTPALKWAAPHLGWAAIAVGVGFGWTHYWDLRADLADTRVAAEQTAQQLLAERESTKRIMDDLRRTSAAKARGLENTAKASEEASEQLRKQLERLAHHDDPALVECLSQPLPAGWMLHEPAQDRPARSRHH